jgi:hypothetical protein
MESETFEGVWIVVNTPSGGFIGRVRKDIGDDPSKPSEVKESMAATPLLKLEPAFEFQCGLQQVIDPETHRPLGLAKQSLTTTIDLCIESIPLYVHTAGGTVYFLSEMKTSDVVEYKKQVEQAMEQAVQMRAKRSGITLSREMPQGTPPTGSA